MGYLQAILSSSQMASGPDFVFDDEYFFPLLAGNGSKGLKEELTQWNASDASNLTRVIAKLLEAFRCYLAAFHGLQFLHSSSWMCLEHK